MGRTLKDQARAKPKCGFKQVLAQARWASTFTSLKFQFSRPFSKNQA